MRCQRKGICLSLSPDFRLFHSSSPHSYRFPFSLRCVYILSFRPAPYIIIYEPHHSSSFQASYHSPMTPSVVPSSHTSSSCLSYVHYCYLVFQGQINQLWVLSLFFLLIFPSSDCELFFAIRYFLYCYTKSLRKFILKSSRLQ